MELSPTGMSAQNFYLKSFPPILYTNTSYKKCKGGLDIYINPERDFGIKTNRTYYK